MSRGYCPDCGAAIDQPQADFCTDCGARLRAKPPEEPTVRHAGQRIEPPASGPAQETDGQAVAALVLGILGLGAFSPLGILAVLLGGSAKKRIAASQGRRRGTTLATAGIVLGCVSLAVLGVQFLLLFSGSVLIIMTPS